MPHPSTRTALTVLCVAEDAAAGDREARGVLRTALRRWLPLRLSSFLTSRAYPAADAVAWAVRVITAGLPEPDELVAETPPETASEEEAGASSWAAIDWAGRIAEYAHAYGTPPQEVLAMPFATFLVFLRETPRIHAQAQLRDLTTRSLPYADAAERHAILDDLRARAGAPGDGGRDGFEGLSEEAAIEKQKDVLARWNRALGRGRAE